jgi:hypothetical protein
VQFGIPVPPDVSPGVSRIENVISVEIEEIGVVQDIEEICLELQRSVFVPAQCEAAHQRHVQSGVATPFAGIASDVAAEKLEVHRR